MTQLAHCARLTSRAPPTATGPLGCKQQQQQQGMHMGAPQQQQQQQHNMQEMKPANMYAAHTPSPGLNVLFEGTMHPGLPTMPPPDAWQMAGPPHYPAALPALVRALPAASPCSVIPSPLTSAAFTQALTLWHHCALIPASVATTQMPGSQLPVLDQTPSPVPFGLLPPAFMGQPGMHLAGAQMPPQQPPPAGMMLQQQPMPSMPGLAMPVPMPVPNLQLMPPHMINTTPPTPTSQNGSPHPPQPAHGSSDVLGEDAKREKRKQSNRCDGLRPAMVDCWLCCAFLCFLQPSQGDKPQAELWGGGQPMSGFVHCSCSCAVAGVDRGALQWLADSLAQAAVV